MSGRVSDIPIPPATLWTRVLSGAEVWVYELNEKNHWIFRLYDRLNEFWARLVYRQVRMRAADVNCWLDGHGVRVRMRLLAPDDLEDFAGLLQELSRHRYLPPHPLDRHSAEMALARRSFLPFGIFDDGQLVGYFLVRLFFPRRAATGVWLLSQYHDSRLGTAGVRATGAFTSREGFGDYITVPLDNIASLRGAVTAGWRVVRRNRRFYVLLRE